jgi:hypothetical protein
MSDPRLRFRVWIGGKLIREDWTASPAEGRRLADEHRALVDAATDPWLIEVYDPDQPAQIAHLRFGTDTAGMTCPVQVILAPQGRDHP